MKSFNSVIFATASGASNATSSVVDSLLMRAASAQAVTTSTLAGTLQMQGSNDASSPTHWFSVGSAVTISAPGSVVIPRQETCYRWIRVVFTASSGSGNITMTFNGQAE